MFIHHLLARLLGELEWLQIPDAVTLFAKPRAGYPPADRHLSVKRGHKVEQRFSLEKKFKIMSNFARIEKLIPQKKATGKVSPDFQPSSEGRSRMARRGQTCKKPCHCIHFSNISSTSYKHQCIQYRAVPDLSILA